MNTDAAQAQENKQERDRRKNHTMSGDCRSIRAVVSWVVLLVFLVTAVLPLPALAGDAVFYYHNDATGSPVAITNSAGTVVWKADYEPFGELAGLVENVPNQQQFLAKTVDPETSLHLLGARYYDGKMGRFLGVDPALLQGQQAGSLGRSQFLNLYSYSINNPYRFSDPTGNTPIDLIFLAVDVARFGVAVYTGVGIGAAAVDVGLSLAGVVSPVAGTGEVLKAGQVAERTAEAVRGAGRAVDAARDVSQLSNEAQRGIRSLEKQIVDHEKKLADFKARPTVRPGMENLPAEVIEQQQQRRVQHLEKEIQTFKDNIQKIVSNE